MFKLSYNVVLKNCMLAKNSKYLFNSYKLSKKTNPFDATVPVISAPENECRPKRD